MKKIIEFLNKPLAILDAIAILFIASFIITISAIAYDVSLALVFLLLLQAFMIVLWLIDKYDAHCAKQAKQAKQVDSKQSEVLYSINDFTDEELFEPDLEVFLREEGVFDKIVANMRNAHKDKPYTNRIDKRARISSSFMWSETPEGHDFWRKLNGKYLERIKEKARARG